MRKVMSIEALLGIVSACVGGGLFYLGFRQSGKSNNLSTYVPVDKISNIPIEFPVVVTGTVTTDQPLISPVTQKPCVYFEYTLEREEETKDDKGNASFVWKKVGSIEKQTMPFYLQDQSGKILIKPENCEVNGIYRTQQFLQQGTIQNAQSTGMKILAAAIQMATPANGNRERVTEYTILTGANLNAFGIITVEGEQKFIQKTNDYPLILSPLSKDQLVGAERKIAFILYGLALTLVALGIFLLIRA
jgi:hypothetical protein